MRRLTAAAALLLFLSAGSFTGEARASSSDADGVSVQVDRTSIDTQLGGRFTITSTVHNESGETMSGLIAHLNVLSSDPETYVDPEDWSSRRTQYLDPLAPHRSATLTWHVQAVNSGSLILYVAVTDTTHGTVTAGPPIELAVTRQPSIDAGGILPLAIGVPAAVGLLMAFNLLRRRRTSS
jgi:thiamine pyrophosphate-dependent acetolactate synthase large subunit-like protein